MIKLCSNQRDTLDLASVMPLPPFCTVDFVIIRLTTAIARSNAFMETPEGSMEIILRSQITPQFIPTLMGQVGSSSCLNNTNDCAVTSTGSVAAPKISGLADGTGRVSAQG